MQTVDQIHPDLTRKKLREDSHERWVWLHCFAGKCHGKPVRDVIEQQLAELPAFDRRIDMPEGRIRRRHDPLDKVGEHLDAAGERLQLASVLHVRRALAHKSLEGWARREIAYVRSDEAGVGESE